MTKEEPERVLKKQGAKSTRRILNFRGLLMAALFLMSAVFAALVFCVAPAIGAILIALIILLAVCLGVFYRKRKTRLFAFIICVVISITAFCSFVITEKNWTASLDYSKEMSVVGTVESDIEIDGTRRIYLSNVSLNGESVKGKLLIYVKNGAIQNASGKQGFVTAGAVVRFSGAVTPKNLVDGFKVFGKRFRDGLRYQSQVGASDISEIGHRDPSIFIKTRSVIYKKLTGGLGREYGELCYSFLTGDKAYLEIQVKNYFSAAGLAHLLAVSGMQLGFLSAIVVWIYKKLRARRTVTAVCVCFSLLAYAFVAGFSPSVCRAAVMSLVGVAVYLFGKRNDSLSSLSLAFCLIVTVAPFFMFETGFILSFCAIFGIVLFKKPLECALLRLFPASKSRTANALCFSLATNLKDASQNENKNNIDFLSGFGENQAINRSVINNSAASYGRTFCNEATNNYAPSNVAAHNVVYNAAHNVVCNNESDVTTKGDWCRYSKFSQRPKIQKLRNITRKKLVSAFAFGLAVQIGILPAIIHIFNNFQLYGLIINILLMPLVVFTFTSAVVCLIISIIIPPLQVHFFIPKLGFWAIDFVAASVSNLPLARVVVYALPLIFTVYLVYFLCSNYVNLPKKWAFRLGSIVLCGAMLVFQSPTTIEKSSIVPLDIGNSAVTYISDGERGYLIGDVWSGYLVLDELKQRRVRKLDAVFVDDMNFDTAVQMQVLAALFSDFVVYYPAVAAPPSDSAEGQEVLKKLNGIEIVAFESTDESGVNIVELIGAGSATDDAQGRKSTNGGKTILEAVFVNGSFSAYGFKKVGLESSVNVLIPKANFRYNLFSGINDYNIIRAYRFRDAGSKLYLIGEDSDTSNSYITKQGFCYNYKTYKFY